MRIGVKGKSHPVLIFDQRHLVVGDIGVRRKGVVAAVPAGAPLRLGRIAARIAPFGLRRIAGREDRPPAETG
ncbi:MAG: hypothetical protein Q8J92_09600, partial [Parvibaculum sp.]|nr:hypothetical protein [Parvibaculum sp.]